MRTIGKSLCQFVINGDFSEKFMKSMGFEKMEFPLFQTVCKPTMPIDTIKLAYSEVNLENYRGMEQSGSSLGS